MAAVGAALAAYALSYPLNHDVGWYLYVARAVLNGEALYTEIVEVNPPLVIYLSMLPVSLASLTGLGIEAVVEGLVIALAFGTVVCAWWLASGVVRSETVCVLAVALLIAFLGIAGSDFGQREHLMMMLTTPYVIILWRRLMGAPPGRQLALASGVLAGVGFALKPHFLILWISVEAFWFVRGRQKGQPFLRPELLAVVVIGATYLAGVEILHPEYFGLAWDARDVYGQFAARNRLGLLGAPHALAVLAGIFVLWRGESRLLELIRIYLTIAVAGLAMAVLQGKGWAYHYHPMLATLVVAGVLILWEKLRSRASERPSGLTVAMILLFLVATGYLVAGAVAYHTVERSDRLLWLEAGSDFLERSGTGGSLVIFSDRVSDAFPLVTESSYSWASPYPSTWWIQGKYERTMLGRDGIRSREDMQRVEHEFAELSVNRFTGSDPTIVLVDTMAKPYYGGVPFPYLDYFGQWPGFRSEWEHYERYGSLGGLAAWRRTGP